MSSANGRETLHLYGSEREDRDGFRQVSEAVERINEAVIRAVNSGLCVEVVRSARYHDGNGCYGDQISIRAEPKNSSS